jgi:hypothetical protein
LYLAEARRDVLPGNVPMLSGGARARIARDKQALTTSILLHHCANQAGMGPVKPGLPVVVKDK